MKHQLAPSLGDLRKFINKTRDKTTKMELRKMCTDLCKSDRGIASTTPILPSDVVFFFKSKSTLRMVRDVRRMPHVLAFVEWRSGFNDITTKHKKELDGFFHLCAQTLTYLLGIHETLVRSMLIQFFCGHTSVFAYFDQALCLHTGCMVCNTSCVETQNNVASFLSGICSHVSRDTQNTVTALHTSISFTQTEPKLDVLTSWARVITRSLFGPNATCVLVVRFKSCVRVFHEKDKKPTVMFVVHTNSDRVFCKPTLFLALQANDCFVIEKQIYVDVTFLPHGGIYGL